MWVQGRLGGWACGRQRGIAAVQARNYYFFFVFLVFLLFLAMCITPLPDPVGQRNVDRVSTYH
jgi:hypothetical protein